MCPSLPISSHGPPRPRRLSRHEHEDHKVTLGPHVHLHGSCHQGPQSQWLRHTIIPAHPGGQKSDMGLTGGTARQPSLWRLGGGGICSCPFPASKGTCISWLVAPSLQSQQCITLTSASGPLAFSSSPDNAGQPPHHRILNLITPAKPFQPEVLGIRWWHLAGP